MNLMEVRQDRQHALDKADRILKAAESAKRVLTADESREIDNQMLVARTLETKIKSVQSKNTITDILQDGRYIPAAGNLPKGLLGVAPRVLSEEYFGDFYQWLASRGQRTSAALYEGAGSSGGYAVPVIVDGQVVPLAPTPMGVRAIATVIPTASDIKMPQQASFGTAAGKAESGGSDNFFTESDPTLSQITLSAFMAGISHTISWELAQDVPTFQEFAVRDLILALEMYESNKFVNGTGSSEPQGLIGLIGNTGTGVTGVLAGSDSYASELLNATFDVLGKLNPAYFNSNTRWLMQPATAVAIRKAQMQSNLFAPVFTSQNGKDYLHGVEVAYDGAMPAIAAGNTPILYGSFKDGYIIGDRGGSGINVKILDQPKATEGQLILLA